MSALPRISRTIRQRRSTAEAAKHASVRDYQRAQRARIESHVAQLRSEHPEPAIFVDQGMSDDPVTVSIPVWTLVLVCAAGGAMWVLIFKFMGWLA